MRKNTAAFLRGFYLDWFGDGDREALAWWEGKARLEQDPPDQARTFLKKDIGSSHLALTVSLFPGDQYQMKRMEEHTETSPVFPKDLSVRR